MSNVNPAFEEDLENLTEDGQKFLEAAINSPDATDPRLSGVKPDGAAKPVAKPAAPAAKPKAEEVEVVAESDEAGDPAELEPEQVEDPENSEGQPSEPEDETDPRVLAAQQRGYEKATLAILEQLAKAGGPKQPEKVVEVAPPEDDYDRLAKVTDAQLRARFNELTAEGKYVEADHVVAQVAAAKGLVTERAKTRALEARLAKVESHLTKGEEDTFYSAIDGAAGGRAKWQDVEEIVLELSTVDGIRTRNGLKPRYETPQALLKAARALSSVASGKGLAPDVNAQQKARLGKMPGQRASGAALKPSAKKKTVEKDPTDALIDEMANEVTAFNGRW